MLDSGKTRKILRKAVFGFALFSFSFTAYSQTISVGSPMNAVEGSGNPMSFIVSLDNGAINTTGAPITGTITLTGTASNGVDYNGPSSFSIANGANSIGVLVPVIDDGLTEGNETMIVTISNLNVGTINNATTTAIIIDDEVASLQFSIGSPTDGAEAGGNVGFVISLDFGAVNNTGAAITGTINYTGTAIANTDFVGSTLFTIQNGSNSTNIGIAVIDDNLVECDETVIATISNPTAGVVNPAASSSTATITDNECTQLTMSISSPVTTVVEGVANITYDVSLDNGVVNGTGAAITGTVNLSGTATSPSDYINVTGFSIPNGANSGQIVVTVVDDAVVESTETLTATISSPSVGSVSPGGSSVTVSIIDDDAGALFIEIGSPVDAIEGSSDVTFTVSIVGGGTNTTGVPITGSLSYAGDASSPADYIAVTNFSIAPGASSTTITLTVIDDAILEPTETVIATLTGSPSIGSYANTSVTANIFDDDVASLTISIGSPTDGMEGSTFASYIVSLDGGILNTTGASITGVISYSGTATDGTDYTGASTFSIPDGVGSSLIIVPVIDDILVECNETVIATISSPNVGLINPAAASSIANIIDDECAQTLISIGSPMDGEEGVSDVSFVVSLDNGATNGTGADIYGALSFSGTTNFADFNGLPPTIFSIPNGANSTTIILDVADDALLECDETVIATISSPNVGIISNATSTALVIDNECNSTMISIDTPTDGTEGATDVSFIISLDNGVVNGTGAAITGDVDFTGTATAGSDFIDLSTFSIPDGASYVEHVLGVVNDLDVECDETVIATISNPNFGLVNPAAETSTAIIIDDECTNSIGPVYYFGLHVYPNPINSEVNLQAEELMKSYSISDLHGRVIAKGRIDSKTHNIEADFMSAGYYVISILFEDGSIVKKKMVKE